MPPADGRKTSSVLPGVGALRIARSDRELLGLALATWRETYGRGHDYQTAYSRLLDHEIALKASMRVQATGARAEGVLDRSSPILREVVDDPQTGMDAALYQVLSRWAQDGYGWIRCEPSFAAALMCTDPSGVVQNDLKPNWGVFLAEIPRGLLTYRDRSLDRAFVDIEPDGVAPHRQLYLFDSRIGLTAEESIARVRPSFQALLIDDDAKAEEEPEEQRLLTLGARLVLGAVVTMQFTTNFRWEKHAAQRSRSPWQRGLPAHRVAVVGHPLTLDLSDAVRDLAAGVERGPAAVQSLVRGHYKRQVCGPHGSERKVIWVEPYWRGPEDAPIVARPYKVGPG